MGLTGIWEVPQNKGENVQKTELLEFIVKQLDREYANLDYNQARAEYFSNEAAKNDATIIALERMENETEADVAKGKPKKLHKGKQGQPEECRPSDHARRLAAVGPA